MGAVSDNPGRAKGRMENILFRRGKILKDGLTECGILRISHIGSTAIKEIAAKPIVDILVEIAPDEDMRIQSAKK